MSDLSFALQGKMKRCYSKIDNDKGAMSLKKKVTDCESSDIVIQEEKTLTCKDFYRYEVQNKFKFGVCLECQKSNMCKKIPMKSGNTSGLKKHLELHHTKAF